MVLAHVTTSPEQNFVSNLLLVQKLGGLFHMSLVFSGGLWLLNPAGFMEIQISSATSADLLSQSHRHAVVSAASSQFGDTNEEMETGIRLNDSKTEGDTIKTRVGLTSSEGTVTLHSNDFWGHRQHGRGTRHVDVSLTGQHTPIDCRNDNNSLWF